jgi:methylphosphotriester-DNA--protein-cysteine methyltransferase
LLAAARSLAAGASLNDATFDAGYASASAFIAAFRRETGTTPDRVRSASGFPAE